MSELVKKSLNYWVARLKRQMKWVQEARSDGDEYELKVQLENMQNTIDEMETWMIDEG